MKPSPLQLESYMFTRVHVDACDNPACQDIEGTGQFESNTHCQQHNEDASRWMVTVGLAFVQADGEECPPYTIDIEVVGFFHVADEFPEEKKISMVKANAPAILFGAIREMVANITSRGPYPRFDLPTVTFIDEAQPKAVKANGAE
ncbi:protein-export chaperone SecB [Pontiella agarivorans]|uniref:Protein-export chaperone SecB n=1 Tax=Pontiella agarivorans TaxID=3038953 RepID=A0ABU5MVJ6_9BACT|nr:protein-export chaperone SecB [Pontiella agarivorans]MDZ8118185.1 protein-export chaperone SecB [Pontiella agarivorans]